MEEENYLINADLIKYFKTSSGGIEIFNFHENTERIVPEYLEHHFLINRFDIDESIYKYYHSPTMFLLNNEEFEEILEYRPHALKETALKPYTFCFNGAFMQRGSLIHKLEQIIFSKDKFKPKIINKNITKLDDLKPYFEEFSKGFSKGFSCFEEDEIKPYLPLLADNNVYVQKVSEYVLPPKNNFNLHNYNIHSGFGMNQNYEIINAYNDGLKDGYFYRAWSIILSNCNMFAQFFKEKLSAQKLEAIKHEKGNLEKLGQRKYFAKHYVLTYIFDCNAVGESLPIGKKNEIERIGNNTIGEGKGNAFYKNYNRIILKDLNAEQTLIDEAGESWRQILLNLSKNPEKLETYLQSKQL